MSDARSPTFDEALWFPVQMSAGDSFDRPGNVDGGVAGDNGDDGIGLPGRMVGGGRQRPPKKPGIKASNWLWLTVWGAAALGVVVIAARKEIAAEIGQAWLKGQGVEAKLKIDSLSLSRASGHILVGEANNPELSLDRFDAGYAINLWGGGQSLARIKTLRLVHPVMSLSLKGGKPNFGTLDHLVQNALKAKPSGDPPPESIVIEDAQVRLATDYGLVNLRGGMTLDAGRIKDLALSVPQTALNGPLGEGTLKSATVTVRALKTQAGPQLAAHAVVVADSWTHKTGSLAEDADVGQKNVRLDKVNVSLDASLPYTEAKSPLEAFNGAATATLALKAAKVHSTAADMEGLEANLTLGGLLKLANDAQSFDGRARLLGRADGLESGETHGRDLRVNAEDLALKAGFESGAGMNLALSGPLTADAGALNQGDMQVRTTHLDLASVDVQSGDKGLEIGFRGHATTGRLAASDLVLEAARASLDGAVHSDSETGDWNFTLLSDIASDRGQYSGLSAIADAQVKAKAEAAAAKAAQPVPDPRLPPPLPVKPAGPDSIVMLDRAFERFSLRVNGLKVQAAGSANEGARAPRIDIRLNGGVTANLQGGGSVKLNTVAGKPLLATGQAGAFAVVVDGPDLPHVALGVDQFGQTSSGTLAGDYTLDSQFTVAPISGASVQAKGRFAMTPGGDVRVTLGTPARFTADAADMGDHVEDVQATLTQTGDTFLIAGPKGWRVNGAFRGLTLSAPNEAGALGAGEGTFSAFSIAGGSGIGLDANLAKAVLSDALPAEKMRFYPLGLSGTLRQDARALKGRFIATSSRALSGGKPTPIAAVDLDNDVATGAGSLAFRTLDLTFEPRGGLQPVFLSPTVAAVFSKDVSGKAAFEGAFTWSKTSSESHGRLSIDGLNFTGAAGVSKGLKGAIEFTSLSPLISKPHQLLGIDKVMLGIPLEHLRLDVQFLGDHLAVEQADVVTPGGPMALEPMTVPFDGVSPISGTMTFDGLDFGKIIAATSLNDSMTYTGKVSGKLPFSVAAGRVTFAKGALASDAPGMISIKRVSLTGVQATGSVSSPDVAEAAAPAPSEFNPFQDLAFQAMEYLAYDQIDARINSTKNGILDVNFHIKGHFAPPQRQKAKISLFDYLNGSWMTKPIKLPSNTPVELFLDVPINLDEILSDLTAFNVRTATKAQ